MNIELTEEMVSMLEKIIEKHVPERKAYALRARLGTSGRVVPYREIGKQLGVTGPRAQQYYKWAIAKIKRVILKNPKISDVFFVPQNMRMSKP